MEPIRVILPTEEKKYVGCIRRIPRADGSIAYTVLIGQVKYCKVFNSYQEAFHTLQRKNVKKELPIKNVILEFEDYLEVELTQGKRMKCSKQDLPHVQKFIWFVQNDYASCSSAGKFHNHIQDTPSGVKTLDHIDNDSLNNQRSNSRVADRRTQSINRGLYKNNTSGTKGVRFVKSPGNGEGRWLASWQEENGKQKIKSFGVRKYGYEEAKQLALAAREEALHSLEHYVEALSLDD